MVSFYGSYQSVIKSVLARDGVMSVSTSSYLRFSMSRSCMYIDGNGSTHEIDEEDMGRCKTDPLGEIYLIGF